MAKKYRVYAIYTASKFIGEFEAETPEEAKDMADETGEGYAMLCHQCADEYEMGDYYEYQTEEIE